MTRVAVVIPTVGRSSLDHLLHALEGATGPRPTEIIVVDDSVARRGPANARNAGWRAALDADWVAFLDDDVLPSPTWFADLATDLADLPLSVAASCGRIDVPLPSDRRPTDWERNVGGLAGAQWATADMVFRRVALEAVGGFDERFPRAYREDADIGLRLTRSGWDIVTGTRRVTHPVRPADRWVSVRLQRGNADDVLMAAIHGRTWRKEAAAGPSAKRRYAVTTALSGVGLAAVVAGRRRVAAAALAGWAASTAEFAWRRIAPGPRTRSEVVTMLATSIAIPPVATWHTARGLLDLFQVSARGRTEADRMPTLGKVSAVLFDRDGTLLVDVPFNGNPARVEPMPGAREALDRVRAAGLKTAVVSNQSGVARRLITEPQVHAVNRRMEELLGPFDAVVFCPHGPDDGCACRKPAPGLVKEAAVRLGVDPTECAVIGDIGSDVDAAAAAGARAILVPTAATRAEEIAGAPEVAASITDAVDKLLAAV